jgi:hypothetical protein
MVEFTPGLVVLTPGLVIMVVLTPGLVIMVVLTPGLVIMVVLTPGLVVLTPGLVVMAWKVSCLISSSPQRSMAARATNSWSWSSRE